MLEGQKASGTMAGAAGEITPSTSQEDDPARVTFEEPKGEKKKKFNPLEKMRKFFKGSKKQPKSKDVTSSKSRSTGALHQSTTSDDEDDGGFKSHNMPTLAGNRSISEDSIFNPEQKEANVEALRKTAVSMEAINQDFKRELAMKLRGRAHSESGYSYSPTQPMTTADIVMGSRLKPLPPGSKSRSLESDRSLISSEGDEGDIFRSNWGASVDGKRPRSTGSLSDEQVDMDFTVMSVDTPTLASTAAKHKISVKPKSRRLSTKSFRRNREAAGSPLPDVKEESVSPREETATKLPEPVKSISTQENKTVIQISGFGKEDNKVPVMKKAVDENTAMKSASLPRNLEKTEVIRKHSGQEEPKSPVRQPQTQMSPVAGLEEVKLRKPRPTSLIETHESDKSEKSELANAFKRMSVKREESPLKEEGGKVTDVVQAKKEKEIMIDSYDFTKSGGAVSNKENDSKFGVSLKSSTPTSPVKSPTSGVTFVLKKEPLKPQSSVTKNENVKPTSTNDTNEKDVTVQGEVTPKLSPTKSSFKENDDKLTKLPSPREDYRAKREGRSKTLPEQPVSKEFLNKKDFSSSAKFSQSLSNKDENSGKVESKPETATSPIGRRTEPKRMSWVGSSSSSTSDSSVPPWIQMAKKRQGSEVTEVEKKEPKPVVSLSREPAKVKTTDSFNTSKTSNPVSSGATKEQKDIINGSKKSPDEQKDDVIIKPLTTTSAAKTDIAKPLVSKLSDNKTEPQPVLKPLAGKVTDTKTEVQSVNKSVSGKVTPESKPETQTAHKSVVEKSSESLPVKPVSGKLTDVKSDTQPEHKPLAGKTSDVKVETQSMSKTYSTKPEPEQKSVPVASRIMAMKKETETTQQQLHKSTTLPSKVQPVKKDTETVNKLSSNTKTQEVKEVKKEQEPAYKSFSNKGLEVKKDPEPVHKPLISKASDSKKENENLGTSLAGKTSLFERKNVSSGGSVPAWKSNLPKKDKEVKIEIIEKPSGTAPVNTVQPKATTTKAVEEKPSVLREKPVEKCTDGATNRKSKVLDLVKNYQKLQVS